MSFGVIFSPRPAKCVTFVATPARLAQVDGFVHSRTPESAMPTRIPCRAALLLLAFAGPLACGGRQHLGEYAYVGKTMGITYGNQPVPLLYSGFNLNDNNPPFEQVYHSPERLRRDILAKTARARLDSAAAAMDFPAEFASRVLARASEDLGTRAVADPKGADLLLEVSVQKTGLQLYQPRTPGLFVEAECVLRDARTGRTIWQTSVRQRELLTQFLDESGQRHVDLGPVLTVDKIPVTEYEHMLQQLVLFSAYRITQDLPAARSGAKRVAVMNGVTPHPVGATPGR